MIVIVQRRYYFKILMIHPNWAMESDDKKGDAKCAGALTETNKKCPHRSSSSTCSTESTISFTSSMVTPGMIRSASVNARWSALRAIRASWVDTRGNSLIDISTMIQHGA